MKKRDSYEVQYRPSPVFGIDGWVLVARARTLALAADEVASWQGPRPHHGDLVRILGAALGTRRTFYVFDAAKSSFVPSEATYSHHGRSWNRVWLSDEASPSGIMHECVGVDVRYLLLALCGCMREALRDGGDVDPAVLEALGLGEDLAARGQAALSFYSPLIDAVDAARIGAMNRRDPYPFRSAGWEEAQRDFVLANSAREVLACARAVERPATSREAFSVAAAIRLMGDHDLVRAAVLLDVVRARVPLSAAACAAAGIAVPKFVLPPDLPEVRGERRRANPQHAPTDEGRGRRWGIARRPNPPVGRFDLTAERVAEIAQEGRVLAQAARSGRRTAQRALAWWAGSVAELAQQVSFQARREASWTRDTFVQQAINEREVAVLSLVAGPLLRGAVAVRDGAEPVELLSLADPGSKLSRDMALLAPTWPGRGRTPPPSVVVPHMIDSTVGGLRVVVGEVPGEAAALPEVVVAGLRIFREVASRVAPWMVGPKAAPVELLPYSGHGMAGYVHDAAVVRLYLPRLSGETPAKVAHVAAHEQGHHAWRTRLSALDMAAWSALVRERVAPLDVDAVMAAWPQDKRTWPLQSVAQEIADELAPRRGPIALQVVIASRYRAVRDLGLRDLARWRDAGGVLMVPAKPVSVYGAGSAEEAFCDAGGLLVSAGPQALDPEALDLLRELAPGTRINGARGRRRSVTRLTCG